MGGPGIEMVQNLGGSQPLLGEVRYVPPKKNGFSHVESIRAIHFALSLQDSKIAFDSQQLHYPSLIFNYYLITLLLRSDHTHS